MKIVLAAGAFDDVRAKDFRFFEEASKLGELNVIVWSDEIIHSNPGTNPKFPEAERVYFLEAIKYIDNIYLLSDKNIVEGMEQLIKKIKPDIFVIEEKDKITGQKYLYTNGKIEYWIIPEEKLKIINLDTDKDLFENTGKKKIIVTGCFDWFHSGHVAFLEEASTYGDLYVIVGNDQNIKLLKGDNHPMFPQEVRRYILQSINFVKKAFVSTGHGWMDAEPEIMEIKPDIYIVNEDGNVSEKKEFCKMHDIEYLVLKRVPKKGLPIRTGTVLRNF